MKKLENENIDNDMNESISNSEASAVSHTDTNLDNKEDILKMLENETIQCQVGNDLKKKKHSNKGSFSNKKFKNGAYSTLITAVVVVMVLIINLIIGQLDLKIDISKDAMYTLTDETKSLVKGTKDDIVIYYIAGESSAEAQVKQIVDKYSSISDNVSVVMKDPVLYPKFASQYVSEDVSENSVIVVNNTSDKFKYVPYSDMLQQSYDSSYNSYVSGVDVEGQITSAISYVTAEDLPIVYTVQGHGETEINTTLASNIAKQNVTTETLDTLSADSIPEDCSMLLMNAPVHDYTEAEVKLIEDYLKAGGDAIILVTYTTEDMPNFDSLLSYYGISLAPGVVVEGDSNCYMSGYPTYIIPTIESHDITSTLSSKSMPVVIPVAKGIVISDSVRSTVTIDPILTTSDKAFSKTNVNSSTSTKEDGDIDGPFNLGVAITETYNDVETKLVVYSSSYLIDEEMLNYSQLGNSELFMSTISNMSDQATTLSIPIRSVEESYITVNSSQMKFWGSVVTIVMPLIFIGIGTYVCLRRRRR